MFPQRSLGNADDALSWRQLNQASLSFFVTVPNDRPQGLQEPWEKTAPSESTEARRTTSVPTIDDSQPLSIRAACGRCRYHRLFAGRRQSDIERVANATRRQILVAASQYDGHEAVSRRELVTAFERLPRCSKGDAVFGGPPVPDAHFRVLPPSLRMR